MPEMVKVKYVTGSVPWEDPSAACSFEFHAFVATTEEVEVDPPYFPLKGDKTGLF